MKKESTYYNHQLQDQGKKGKSHQECCRSPIFCCGGQAQTVAWDSYGRGGYLESVEEGGNGGKQYS